MVLFRPKEAQMQTCSLHLATHQQRKATPQLPTQSALGLTSAIVETRIKMGTRPMRLILASRATQLRRVPTSLTASVASPGEPTQRKSSCRRSSSRRP